MSEPRDPLKRRNPLDGSDPLKAIVVGNGTCPDRRSLPRDVLEGARLVVAADGGAACADALQLRPDLVVGDGDSLEPAEIERLARSTIPFDRVSPDKDQSDLELAVLAALSRGATELVVLAALHGDRIEHSVANLLMLALPELADVDVRLVEERSSVRLLTARGEARTATLHGQPRDFVSLFAWTGPVEGVTTEGLRFPLREASLRVGPSRGLSNEFLDRSATVGLRNGQLLIVQTRRTDDASNRPAPEPMQEARG